MKYFPLLALLVGAGLHGAAAQSSPGAVVVQDGGREREFVIATDEVASIDPRGKVATRAVSGATSLATIAAQAQSRFTGQEAEVVLYEKGAKRNEFTRRILTKGVVVEVKPGTDAKALAANVGADYEGPAPAPANTHILRVTQAGSALAVAEALRAQPGVVSANPLLARQQRKRLIPNDPLFTSQWHLRNTGQGGGLAGTDINVVTTWDTYKGSGVRIGIVDDGIQTTHPDLSPNLDLANSYDWNGQDSDPNPDVKADDHGTSCAGVAAGRGSNGIGISGAAPLAKLVGMRLIGGPATDADEADAFTYEQGVIPIKSNSWGPDDDGQTLEGPGTLGAAALQSAATTGRGGKGTIFTWAAGNGGDVGDNSNYDGYANSIYTIAVAAVSDRGTAADYSEPGANVVISAPSSSAGRQGITTTDLLGNNGYNAAGVTGELSDRNYTKTFGGTSSACPLAAGVIALILEANPNLGWRDVQGILMKSATKNSPTDADWVLNRAGQQFNHKFGAGLINAGAAVNLAKTWANLPPQQSITSNQTGLNISIPDNNATGIVRTFSIGSPLRVEHVTVALNLSHTNRGQLEILLTSPSGTVSRLAEKHADTGDNYNWTFMTVRNWGENSQGIWRLTVRDRVRGTVGRLTAARLTIYGSSSSPANPPPATTTQTFTSTNVPRSIPDNNLTGITSNLTVSLPGKVSAASLNLNIQHPYQGDLRVSLISPAGKEVFIQDNIGGGFPNIVLSNFSVPGMVGQTANGTWKIKAVDNAAEDVGSLVSWSFTLTN